VRVGTPFLTWYGDGRVELSYATFGNWVAKTANLLRDGWDVQPGDPVGVDLPPHWQGVAVVFGIRLAGAVVGDGPVRFVWRDGVVVEPGGADYAAEVLAYGDAFPGSLDLPPGDVAPGERVLLREPASLAGVVSVAEACHAVGASLVVGDADPAAERVTRVLG
jgi:hypothetical protein